MCYEKHYKFIGVNNSGKKITGTIIASNRNLARAKLENRGIAILKLRTTIKIKTKKNRIKTKTVTGFIRQLASLINSGIPILSSLNITETSYQNTGIENIIRAIKKDINSGLALSKAFEKHPKYFDNLFCGLLYVGEQSGTLDKILIYAADYNEKSNNIRRKIKKALFYPTTIILTASAVTTLLLVFVVPQFAKLFEGFGATLPLYTRIIIKVANFTKTRGITSIPITVIIIFLLKLAKHKHKPTSTLFDKLVLQIPVIGTQIKKMILTRFSLILAINHKAGIPIVKALQITAKTINNRTYQDAIIKAEQMITSGQNLNTALTENSFLFPPRIGQMISIGEESGTLTEMLTKISQYYQEELDYLIDNINNLLEPIIMVILGILVGGLVIGMYLPIFKLGAII